MRHLAIMLVSLLIAFLGSGCASSVDQIVYVPQKCVIEKVAYPSIERRQFLQGEEIEASKMAVRNYFVMKEYAEHLVNNQKVCE